jgi:hypothetical protein
VVSYRVAVIESDWHAGQISAYLKGPGIRPPAANDILPEIYAELAGKIPNKSDEKEIKIAILPMRQFNDLDGLIADASLTAMSRERGERLNFKEPYPLIRNTVPEKFEYVKETFDYIVVFPVEHKPAPIEHFMSDVGEVVLDSWKHKTLKQDQLEFLSRGQLSSESGNKGEYLLFRSLKRDP